jgi:small subunit ribosomal protein S6
MAVSTTTQVLKNKGYETIYILRSDVDADTAEKVQSRVAEVVAREAGKLVKVEAWGRRKLAYAVGKQKKGVYVYVKYVGRGGLVAELERNLKLADSVIKFQTVLTDEVVQLDAVTVDPEEVKMQRLELAPEAEETESRERALGLLDIEERPRMRDRDDRGPAEEDFADDDAESSPPKAEAKAEKAEPAAGGEEEPS